MKASIDCNVIKGFVPKIIEGIKLSCMAVNKAGGNDYSIDQRKHSGADRRMAFWIANLYEFVGFLQWTVTYLNEHGTSPYSLENNPSDKLLFLIQLRTDMARFVENLCRAWIADLFRHFSRFGVSALLDHQGLTGFAGDDLGHKNIHSMSATLMLPLARLSGSFTAAKLKSIDELISALDELADAVESTHLQAEIASQVFSAVLLNFASASFNQLLLRKNYASWKRGIQIQYNISRLEEWANSLESKNPGYFFSSSRVPSPVESPIKGIASKGIDFATTSTSPLWQIEPLIQAVKLLQLAKTRVASDIDTLVQACPKLNLSQIRRILTNYVPDAYEDGPVSQDILKNISERIKSDTRSSITETLPETQAQDIPLQLSIRPTSPNSFESLPSCNVPPYLWKIFALSEKLDLEQ